MRKFTTLLIFVFATFATYAQLIDYKQAPTLPRSNYYSILQQWRSHFAAQELTLGPSSTEEERGEFEEEKGQFERWAIFWRDRVNKLGEFPNAAQGWVNMLRANPSAFSGSEVTSNTSAPTWTQIGPKNSSISNGVEMAHGIGRVNVVRKVPNQSILLAGTSQGGIFRSTNLGANWTPQTDFLAGLGISDIVINPKNPAVMYAATGDWDKATEFISSIGVYKSTDTGKSWTSTGLTFTLNQSYYIAHLAIDPVDTNVIYATGQKYIHRSDNGGQTWVNYFQSTVPDPFFNDIIKINSNWYVSDKKGKLFKSTGNTTNIDSSFEQVFANTREERLDFAWTPANTNTLYLLSQTNPAFAKFSILTNKIDSFTNINPSNTDYKTQNGYNQVIAVSPTSADSIWVGVMSGLTSNDGGKNWVGKLNGYYNPDSTNGISESKWGGFYVHSDYHDFTFVGSDTLLIGNDGGVYVGKISTNDYKQKFNGLSITQSYSIAVFDADPSNFILGNQDNDGSSSVDGVFYAARAGDGTATAIGRTNRIVRYLGSTEGGLSYSDNGFKSAYKETGDIEKADKKAPFDWDMQMHLANDSILYGGYGDLYKLKNPRSGSTWQKLNSGAVTNVVSITLAERDSTTQKILIIDGEGNVRKSADEVNWTTVARPTKTAGSQDTLKFNSIYTTRKNWDVLLASVPAYDSLNKVFVSSNNGASWTNLTRNFPNIKIQKIIRYEGTDTILVGTELGVYYARISDTSAPAGSPIWQKYGNNLPNVEVKDLEISYAKSKLLVATFGRGVWATELSGSSVLPLHNLDFTYWKGNNGNNLKWKIEDEGIVKTTLEKSYDGVNFKTVEQFKGGTSTFQPEYLVPNESSNVYYRIYYTKATGQTVYSHIILIHSTGASTIVNVYPNPTKGFINVSSANTIEFVRIFNLGGQQLTFAKPMNNYYRFDLSLLPPGTYVIHVTDVKGNNHQEKVVVN